MITKLLYRPVNQAELNLIAESRYIKFPPRLAQQPIFYPVMNKRYADDINEWNKEAYGSGFVVRWEMPMSYLDQFPVQNVGAEHHNELWVPAEQLEEFNAQIIGKIEVI